MDSERMKQLLLSFVVVVSLLACSHAPSVAAQEVEDESEFNYIDGDPKGPSNWGHIKPEWEKCSYGRMQSPIDISHPIELVKDSHHEVKLDYKSAKATIKNRGHDIMVQWNDDAGYATIDGVKYYPKQCHWHVPAEHRIYGQKYDMELHVVHESLTHKVAVIGLLYKIGDDDHFLAKLLPDIKYMTHNHLQHKDIGHLDPEKIDVKAKKFYKYQGSLTVPPCTEHVTWIIEHKIRTVSHDQLYHLKKAVNDEPNARPLQPRNGRDVKLFDKDHDDHDDHDHDDHDHDGGH